jgi:hypothetical protein
MARIPTRGEPDHLVLYLTYADAAFGERNSCTNCPVARALTRWMPHGVWHFDGEAARNPIYGTFWLPMRVGAGRAGNDREFDAIANYDAGGIFPLRILTLVRGDDE